VGHAQGSGYERTFPQSKAAIEKALTGMPTSGRLPVLDGFAMSADRPLERFQRGYYQSKFQVSAAPGGGSVVRVSVQVTAWYADPVAAKSGYQLLTSNGRLETDVLDQLTDQLAAASPAPARPSPPATAVAKPAAAPIASPPPASTDATISAPVPRLPEVRGNYSSSLAQGLEQQKSAPQTGAQKLEDKDGGPLQTEANSLEEILKNQARPKNLVAVKKSGTPVVASASLTAKTLFLASAHDEFEMLDFTRDWVHVRISGLSGDGFGEITWRCPTASPRRCGPNCGCRAHGGGDISRLPGRDRAVPGRLGSAARHEGKKLFRWKTTMSKLRIRGRRSGWNSPSRCSTKIMPNWRRSSRNWQVSW